MISQAEAGRIKGRKRAAGRVLTTPRRPRSLTAVHTGRNPGHMMPRASRSASRSVPTSVYRYYDKQGILLYVGITKRGVRRNFEHDRNAEWWSFVARQIVDHYGTRDEAETQERALIRNFQPPFNTLHNPDAEAMRAAYLAWIETKPGDTDPRALCAALNRHLPLTPLDIGRPDHFVLRTLPEHYPITNRLIAPEPIAVIEQRLVGRIDTIETKGWFTFLHVNGRKVPSVESIASATGTIRYAATGGGNAFRLANVRVTLHGGPAR